MNISFAATRRHLLQAVAGAFIALSISGIEGSAGAETEWDVRVAAILANPAGVTKAGIYGRDGTTLAEKGVTLSTAQVQALETALSNKVAAKRDGLKVADTTYKIFTWVDDSGGLKPGVLAKAGGTTLVVWRTQKTILIGLAPNTAGQASQAVYTVGQEILKKEVTGG